MHVCPYVKCLYSSDALIKLEFCRHTFEKYSNIKFHENPSSGSRVVPCGRKDGRKDIRTNMKKPIFVLRNLAHAPKKGIAYRFRSLGLKCTKVKQFHFPNHSMNKLTKSHRCDASNFSFSRQGYILVAGVFVSCREREREKYYMKN